MKLYFGEELLKRITKNSRFLGIFRKSAEQHQTSDENDCHSYFEIY